MKKTTIAVIAALALGGSAYAQSWSEVWKAAQKAGNVEIDSLNQSKAGANQNQNAKFRADSTPLKDTKLIDALSLNSAAYNNVQKGIPPEWPRIAIRDLDLSDAQCIYFGASIWMNAKQVTRIENIRYCENDIPEKSPNRFLELWLSSVDGDSTGRDRTDGPLPPFKKLPADPAPDYWRHSYNGTRQRGDVWLGSIMKAMGFDPDLVLSDTRRFWIVNIAKLK